MTNTLPLPALPPFDHFALASQVVATTQEYASTLATLPAPARESLEYFTGLTRLANRIETEQPQRLAAHEERFTAALVATGFVNAETAPKVTELLFSSYAMAALLADVAADVIEPIAGRAASNTDVEVAIESNAPASDAQTSPAAPAPAPARTGTTRKANRPALIAPLPDSDPFAEPITPEVRSIANSPANATQGTPATGGSNRATRNGNTGERFTDDAFRTPGR